MLSYTFRTIDQWPGQPTKSRKQSPFRASYSDTLKLLERELRHLGAKNIVIQADCDERMIRQDGMFRSDAKLRGPGVILAFDSKHGPLSYPCDTYPHWDCNLRAIAMALEALRAVDRYGVTRLAEQYKGWAKLPGPTESQAMTLNEAGQLLRSTSGIIETINRGNLEDIYRRACAATHPDIGGDAEKFKRIQEAKAIVDRHFGVGA